MTIEKNQITKSSQKLQMEVQEHVTLRQWTTRYYPHLTYNRIQQAIRNGDLRVNGKKEQPQIKLAPGDVVSLWSQLAVRIPAQMASVHPNLLAKTRVIERNPDFWIIDKPYGVPSQRGTKVNISIVEVMSNLMQLDNNNFEVDSYEPYLVHRLDKHTTGVMVIATNSYAARDLSESLQAGDWNKLYIAEVDGIVDKMEGTIDDQVFGKRSITEYEVLGYKGKHTILQLKPITGRMHQLRQHCARHLYPIVGDTKYDHWGKESLLAEKDNQVPLNTTRTMNLTEEELDIIATGLEIKHTPNKTRSTLLGETQVFQKGEAGGIDVMIEQEIDFSYGSKNVTSIVEINGIQAIKGKNEQLLRVAMHPTFHNPGMRLRCAEIQFDFRGNKYSYKCY